jgi:hypothetical protein
LRGPDGAPRGSIPPCRLVEVAAPTAGTPDARRDLPAPRESQFAHSKKDGQGAAVPKRAKCIATNRPFVHLTTLEGAPPHDLKTGPK